MNLSPLPIQKFFGNDGQPLVGGKLFTYLSGTSTKVATYTDSGGLTQNTNPVVLDYRGECRLWIDPQQSYTFVLAPATDTDPPTAPIWTVNAITAGPAQQDNAATDTGSVNNIALAIPQISSPVAFTRIVFKVANTNTGPVIITINGGTAKNLRYQNTAAFAGGEIIAGGIYEAVFDGTQWQLLDPAVAYWQTAAEIAASVTPTNYWYPEGHVYRYGTNTTPGTTDMRGALNSAMSLIGVAVTIPPETLYCASDLSPPKCQSITGYGEDNSIIKLGASCTKGLSLDSNYYCRYVGRLRIDGTLTTGATGVFLGDAASWAGLIEQVRTKSFTGSNACGFRVADALKSELNCCTDQGSTNGILYKKKSAGFPTTITEINCVWTNAVNEGCLVVDGDTLTQHGSIYESAGKEGCKLLPASAGTIRDFTQYNTRYEDNWTGGGHTSEYQFVAGDGTSLGGAVIQPNLINAKFQTTASTPKAIRMNGSAVFFNIERPNVDSVVSGAISIENSAIGPISTPPGVDNLTLVSDTGNTSWNVEGKAKSWTGTYASSSGNAATTFTGPGTVTTTFAIFRRIGKRCWASFSISATLNAVTPSYITISLPSGIVPAYAQKFVTRNSIAGTIGVAQLVANTDGLLYIYKQDASNYASGAAIVLEGTIEFEIN